PPNRPSSGTTSSMRKRHASHSLGWHCSSISTATFRRVGASMGNGSVYPLRDVDMHGSAKATPCRERCDKLSVVTPGHPRLKWGFTRTPNCGDLHARAYVRVSGHDQWG